MGERDLPGPGFYQPAEVIGAQKMTSSITPTSVRFGFTKARDRFVVPTIKFKSPSPNAYQPKAELSIDVSSKQPKVPRVKFGEDKSNILDEKYHLKAAKAIPGPGSYERYSEFQPK